MLFQIELGRKNIDGANQMVNDKLKSLVAWKSNGPNQENGHEAEVRRWTTQICSEITHSMSLKMHVLLRHTLVSLN